eukprot:5144756-Prymnesium_polylepis.2
MRVHECLFDLTDAKVVRVVPVGVSVAQAVQEGRRLHKALVLGVVAAKVDASQQLALVANEFSGVIHVRLLVLSVTIRHSLVVPLVPHCLRRGLLGCDEGKWAQEQRLHVREGHNVGHPALLDAVNQPTTHEATNERRGHRRAKRRSDD